MSSIKQIVDEAVLGKELTAKGFSITEDEGFAYLFHGEKVIGTYNATRATVERLREDAWGAVGVQ